MPVKGPSAVVRLKEAAKEETCDERDPVKGEEPSGREE